MTMVDKALNQRSQAYARLTECMRETNRYYDSANPSPRLLKQKLEKLEAAKDELLAKHYMYAEKAQKNIASQKLTDWIKRRLDEAKDVAEKVS